MTRASGGVRAIFVFALLSVLMVLGLPRAASAQVPTLPAGLPPDLLYSTGTSAEYGEATILTAPTDLPGARLKLVYQPPREPERVVPVQLPAEITSLNHKLALGLDAHGTLTWVLSLPRGIYWGAVDGEDHGPHKIRRTRGAGPVALYDGKVAYTCRRLKAICRASLTGGGRRTLYRLPRTSDYVIDQLVIGRRSAVGFRQLKTGLHETTRLMIKRRDRGPRKIAEERRNGSGIDLTIRQLTPDGEKLVALRTTPDPAGGIFPTLDNVAWTFPSGHPVPIGDTPLPIPELTP